MAPTKAAIAAALGITPQSFTRYHRQGCPTHSIAAALDWQRRNIDSSQRIFRDARKRAQERRQADAGVMTVGRWHVEQLVEQLQWLIADPAFEPIELPLREWHRVLRFAFCNG